MIIALEGIDGSGKNTQSKILAQRLSDKGYKVFEIGFPCYGGTFFGQEVGAYLNGDFGNLNEVAPKFSALLYAGDRFEMKKIILQAIKENDYIIIDRYVWSNVAHQSAKFTGNARFELQKWIIKLEFDIFELPQPDLNILLHTNSALSQKLVELKQQREYTSKTHDLHENDSSYLDAVSEVYLMIAQNNPSWSIINCTNNDILNSIDSISDEIFSVVIAESN